MTAIARTVMAEPGSSKVLFKKLVSASHEQYIDLDSLIPSSAMIDKARPPKKMDQLWISGTRFEGALTAEQKLEVAWLEVARDASMFIHLEHIIPLVYTGYAHDFREGLDPLVYEYLMLFAREELTHIMAFHRYLKVAELPWYSRPGSYAQLASQLPKMRPEVGIIYTMLIEWTAELGVMYGTQSEEIDPLTRTIFRAHHGEEARHIAFGKKIGEEFFHRTSVDEADQVRAHLRALMRGLIPAFNFNPEIARYTSFTFPIRADDSDAIREVQNSESNQLLNSHRFRDLFAWCEEFKIL